MKAIYHTDQGKVRDHNEDSVAVFYGEKQLLAIVADGMGGHAAGEVASRMAVKVAKDRWAERSDPVSNEEAVQWLNHLVRRINVQIYEYAEKHEECRGMGTTIAAALCSLEGVVVSTVGDSRIYIWKQGSTVRQVSEDHTLVNELVKSGQISKADADSHPKKHILMRALGTEPTIALDTDTMDWTQGTHLLICSDGLTNKLTDDRISEILAEKGKLKDKIEKMINEANDAGGEDNISLIIISHDGDGE